MHTSIGLRAQLTGKKADRVTNPAPDRAPNYVPALANEQTLKIFIVVMGILLAIGGAWMAYHNRSLYIQAALYAEGYTLSATPQVRVEEYYKDRGRFPQDNEQAGLAPPHAIYGTSIKHVSVVRDGVIVVQFNEDSANSTTMTPSRTTETCLMLVP